MTPPSESPRGSPIVRMEGIVKRFGDLLANDHVNFDVLPGEVHALLGENGAGKTTLMKVLYGLYRKDEGTIRVHGEPREIRTPSVAIEMGIGMVTQHFSLVPSFSVAENVVLGGEHGLVYRRNRSEEDVRSTMERFGFQLAPRRAVGELSVGEKQRVEIIKALHRDCEALILDEPTAVLPPRQIESLFETIRRLQKRGVAVIFISHKLNEVLEISDRITVLREGRVVGQLPSGEATHEKLAQLMVGRRVLPMQQRDQSEEGSPAREDVLCEVRNLNLRDPAGRSVLVDVNLRLHAGEILGLVGVSGNGQSELAEILTGMRVPDRGTVLVDGEDVTDADPVLLRKAGVGRVPEDRFAGVVADLTVAENIALESLDEFTDWRGELDRVALNEYTEKLIDEFEIKATPNTRARELSGGNLQKVILARALSRDPRVIIASQPTRGLDVGSIEYIHALLQRQRDGGAAILLISEELDEVLSLADRIAVIYEGRIMDVLETSRADKERLGILMGGGDSGVVDPNVATP